MPTGTRIDAAPTSSSPRSSTTPTAWCRRSSRSAGTGDVLMMAWMNAEHAARDAREGRTVFWSRSRQEVWRKGDTSRRPPVRARGATTTATATRCCSWSSRRATGACHTGEHSCFFRALRRAERDPAEPRRVPRARRATTPSCRCGASCSPTSRRRSPASPSCVGDEPGLPARVGRARRALEPVLVRRPRPVGHARARATASSRSTGTLPADVPRDRGHARRARGVLAAYRVAADARPAAAARRARRLPRLRRRPRGRAPARRAARRPRPARRGAVASSARSPRSTTGASGSR